MHIQLDLQWLTRSPARQKPCPFYKNTWQAPWKWLIGSMVPKDTTLETPALSNSLLINKYTEAHLFPPPCMLFLSVFHKVKTILIYWPFKCLQEPLSSQGSCGYNALAFPSKNTVRYCVILYHLTCSQRWEVQNQPGTCWFQAHLGNQYISSQEIRLCYLEVAVTSCNTLD